MHRAGLLLALAACGAAQPGTDEELVNYACIDAARAGQRAVMPYPTAPPATLPAREVPSALLEKNRIAGARRVLPDSATKDRMRTADVDETRASFRLCIDATGAPLHVDRVYSSCFSGYDEDLRETLATWRYTPFVENGQTLAVCTTVSFEYVAHNRRPGR